jgi:hypothetical protein
MKKPTTAKTLTREQVRALLSNAVQAGDDSMSADCQRYLDLHTDPKSAHVKRIIAALNYAEAQE